MVAPEANDNLRLLQAADDLRLQALVPKPAVEALWSSPSKLALPRFGIGGEFEVALSGGERVQLRKDGVSCLRLWLARQPSQQAFSTIELSIQD